jgi:hypothetical protein
MMRDYYDAFYQKNDVVKKIMIVQERMEGAH